ncbi:hypothetical protein MA16_Dca019800 [Dendrobium catenatum]|uniref:Uncharacterized protein n=1 Tax=Dendrobium catenatum TaxID=906689 RepID=A0A2I0WEI5_9ASPA|nr:hypothetical protein MA16_Dca019800 [Dendrobium catenatum]
MKRTFIENLSVKNTYGKFSKELRRKICEKNQQNISAGKNGSAKFSMSSFHWNFRQPDHQNFGRIILSERLMKFPTNNIRRKFSDGNREF